MTGSCGATGELRSFRRRFYGCLGRRADALFELTDAMLTSGLAPSPVHLSLAAAHRRGWGSLYAALAKGAVDEEILRDLLARWLCQLNNRPITSERAVYNVKVHRNYSGNYNG